MFGETRSLLLKINTGRSAFCRQFYLDSMKYINTMEWRIRNRLPENPNARGPLRDEPDFTYADEKPTPYNIRQRVRIVKQMTYGKEVISLLEKVRFCKEAYQNKLATEQRDVQNYLGRKLKPKGAALLNKKRGRKSASAENTD